MSITTINPATGSRMATYDSHTDDQILDLLTDGHQATLAWGTTPLETRVDVVTRLAQTLRETREELAALITAEMGKPLAEAAAEIEKSAVTAEYYAANAKAILADTPVDVDGADAWIAYEPMGLVYAVMPWNFPFWQAMRFAIPAITAGNGVFLKHSPNVTGSALAIQDVFVAAGLPRECSPPSLSRRSGYPTSANSSSPTTGSRP